MKLRGAVIGISGYGSAHYADLTRIQTEEETIQLTAAAVINQEQEQEKCAYLRSIGCELYDDYKVMLREMAGKIDFCTIPTGILMHKEMTVEALQNGIHVLVEKPAAPDMTSLQAMQDAVSASGKTAAVGFQFNYQKNTRELKELLLSGKMGKILHLRGLCLWGRDSQYYTRNAWSGKRMLGDRVVNDAPFSNATAHYLMLLLYFAGLEQNKGAMPVSVTGNLLRANPEIESCDGAELHYQLENGLTLDYICAHACKKEKGPILEIECEKGRVIWTMTQSKAYTPDGVIEWAHPVRTAYDSRLEMWHAFFAKISGREADITDMPLAGCHTKAVDLAFSTLPIEPVKDAEIIRNAQTGTHRYVIPGFEERFEKLIKQENII